jgi:hypothetical protein
MGRHNWKAIPHRNDADYCTVCGTVRFKEWTAAGPVFKYGRDKQIKLPRCVTLQRSLKLSAVLYVLAFVFVLVSCDCNYHYSRAAKKCAGRVIGDTITVRDTVRVPTVRHDTAFYYNQSDTVIIKQGRLTMKYLYFRDTVKLQGECQDTTIYVVNKVACSHTVPEFNWSAFVYNNRWWLLFIVSALAIAAYLVIRIIRIIRTFGINNDQTDTRF